ncbi:(2Fe-2S) ferredoxin domain-containing protein [Halorubellus sp. JP-L1]|uniref:(2Fe-2S) ferredoxin domain-containing protein n=1 Tax=Halorubellus sp. JP-L1 TaxID=2715753 RepID=UPI00140A0B65|nr:(2Fe-2S) ferredoxin domain-containing protein [Halorubellus sp. JP-L1]NHN41674.1 (2Fe-2S) ferredoxin domain-containing protein [Halorubellus sp. JP-L1]
MRDRTREIEDSGFTDHVLVCTNARDSDYAACADAHGDAVYDAVADWLRDRGVFWSPVQLAETTCLGLCSADGTAIAIHPRSRWYSDVTPEDVPELMRAEFGHDADELGLGPDDEPPLGVDDATAD